MDELKVLKDERRYWFALSVCDGIGPTRFHKLLHYFGSAQNAWNASLSELKESGIGEKISEDLSHFRNTFALEEYEEKLHKLKVSYFTLQDEDYPKLLKQITKPPIILYKKGTYIFNDTDTLVSVVGTRKSQNTAGK